MAGAAQRSGHAAKDAQSIARTFSEHGPRIQRIVTAATRDPEAAADITQEAFVRLLGELAADRSPVNPGAWLYRTAMNLAISRGRRATVARRLEPRLVQLDAAPDPAAVALEHERSRTIEAALDVLAPSERVAVLMAAGGASGVEIAHALGRSHGATRSLLFRARTQLRGLLDGLEAA
jgi:RNA polymerase sigma-70 factor (ECF subfamily)